MTGAGHAGTVRVPARLVVQSLGEWQRGQGPLYQRLSEALIVAIKGGDIPGGSMLPAERVLAEALRVSRGTVVAALRVLQDQGLVERRHGSGTRVAGRRSQMLPEEHAAGVRARRLTGRLLVRDDSVIDLAVSVGGRIDELPADSFVLDVGRLGQLAEGHGYQPAGLPALRRRLAELHTMQGLPTEAEQIVVTTGAQQAIALAARLVLSPGDQVAIEVPTYPGAIDTFARAGAEFIGLATDSGGVRVDEAARALSGGRPRAVYVVPTVHNPTGTVLPIHRRRELAAAVDRSGTWLLEDESLALLTYDGTHPPPVASFASSSRTLVFGSLSKVLWGGLRIGWVRASEEIAMRIARLKATEDLGTGAVAQVIALTLLDDFSRIVDMRRSSLASRAESMVALLEAHFPDWQFRFPSGGVSIWARLPIGTGDDFASRAAQFGVAVLPGSSASVDDSHISYVRLALPGDPLEASEAVDRLGVAWSAYRRTVGPAA